MRNFLIGSASVGRVCDRVTRGASMPRAGIGSGFPGGTALATAALCIALVTAAAFPVLADGGGTSGSGAIGGTNNTTGLTRLAGPGGNGQGATGVFGGGGG